MTFFLAHFLNSRSELTENLLSTSCDDHFSPTLTTLSSRFAWMTLPLPSDKMIGHERTSHEVLPEEIWEKICSHMDTDALCELALTSRKMNKRSRRALSFYFAILFKREEITEPIRHYIQSFWTSPEAHAAVREEVLKMKTMRMSITVSRTTLYQVRLLKTFLRSCFP